jgi:hypothetical protein
MATLGATLALILFCVGLLILLVMAVMLMIGAMSSRSGISSWPQNQEHAFEPFNQRMNGSSGQAWLFSLIGGALVLIIGVGIYFGVTPDSRDIGKSMNMSNLTKKSQSEAPAPAPKQDAPKQEAPKQDVPAEAPADKK